MRLCSTSINGVSVFWLWFCNHFYRVVYVCRTTFAPIWSTAPSSLINVGKCSNRADIRFNGAAIMCSSASGPLALHDLLVQSLASICKRVRTNVTHTPSLATLDELAAGKNPSAAQNRWLGTINRHNKFAQSISIL